MSDGEVRRFGPGSITLVEDLSGKSHASRVVGVRFAVADEHTGQALNAARRNGMLETPGCPASVRTWLQEVAGRRWRRAHDESERNGDEAVSTQRINRVSSIGLILLSLIALLVVLWGYTQPPLPDEGTGAHIFQLSIVALLPMALLFVTTADWSQPWRSARPAAVAAAATVLAFAALYYLEHVYYPGQLR